MNRYISWYRWQLIGAGPLALLALLLLIYMLAPSLSVPAIQRPAGNEAASGAAMVELPAGIHPADRKFYGNGHANYGSAAGTTNTLESVDGADRKFFTNSWATAARAGIADPLANVYPADRKFFTSAYGCTGPGCMTGTNSD